MLCFEKKEKGVTLIELIITMAILSVLAAGVLPLSKMTYKRTKEIELKRNLRSIRNAIDAYKQKVDDGVISVDASSSGYPKTLEILVEGVSSKEQADKKIKFLRRIPKDTMTEEGEWGLRSYDDESDSDSWGGQDVYDVYSKSEQKGIDGSLYKDW